MWGQALPHAPPTGTLVRRPQFTAWLFSFPSVPGQATGKGSREQPILSRPRPRPFQVDEALGAGVLASASPLPFRHFSLLPLGASFPPGSLVTTLSPGLRHLIYAEAEPYIPQRTWSFSLEKRIQHQRVHPLPEAPPMDPTFRIQELRCKLITVEFAVF